jgi:hypothetical protein
MKRTSPDSFYAMCGLCSASIHDSADMVECKRSSTGFAHRRCAKGRLIALDKETDMPLDDGFNLVDFILGYGPSGINWTSALHARLRKKGYEFRPLAARKPRRQARKQ